MQKLLLASTALVASTTFAMADIDNFSLAGSAEMGVFGSSEDLFNDDGDEIEDADLQFHTDIDITFTMAAETDSGLVFGAEIDLDESDEGDAFDANTQGGENIFVSGAFGRLTMGDTDGAADWAMEEAIIGGSIQDDHEHRGYSGNAGLDGTYDGQIARYDYAFGDFSVAASAEIDDTDDGDGDDPILGIGAKYSGEFAGVAFGAGIGYQGGADVADDDNGVDSADASFTGVSLSAKMANGIQGILNYSHYDDDLGGDYDHVGVAVGYEWDAFTVAVNYGSFDFNDDDFADGRGDGYGLIANYDLGGGAELQAGYGYNEPADDTEDFSTYSFGIAMSF